MHREFTKIFITNMIKNKSGAKRLGEGGIGGNRLGCGGETTKGETEAKRLGGGERFGGNGLGTKRLVTL